MSVCESIHLFQATWHNVRQLIHTDKNYTLSLKWCLSFNNIIIAIMICDSFAVSQQYWTFNEFVSWSIFFSSLLLNESIAPFLITFRVISCFFVCVCVCLQVSVLSFRIECIFYVHHFIYHLRIVFIYETTLIQYIWNVYMDSIVFGYVVFTLILSVQLFFFWRCNGSDNAWQYRKNFGWTNTLWPKLFCPSACQSLLAVAA